MPLRIAGRRFPLVNECRILLLLNGHGLPLLEKILQHLFCNHKGKEGLSQGIFWRRRTGLICNR
jgi:hypothetical protein